MPLFSGAANKLLTEARFSDGKLFLTKAKERRKILSHKSLLQKCLCLGYRFITVNLKADTQNLKPWKPASPLLAGTIYWGNKQEQKPMHISYSAVPACMHACSYNAQGPNKYSRENSKREISGPTHGVWCYLKSGRVRKSISTLKNKKEKPKHYKLFDWKHFYIWHISLMKRVFCLFAFFFFSLKYSGTVLI